MRSRSDLEIDVIGYDGTIDSMEQVVSGVLDAAVMDDCIFNFYADRFAPLRAVGRPFAGGYYTIISSRETPALGRAIDEALGKIIADGRLKRIYDRWDLAGRQQILALRDASEIPVASRRSLRQLVASALPLLLASAGMTVLLSSAAFPLAILIGLSIAIGRLHGPAWLRPILAGYVEVVRGTPLMLQLYALFFLLPKIGLALPALVAAILGLAINYSAYESEIYRAGLKAVPTGQFEAAMSLGMTTWQTLRHVIIPQAVRLVMPPVTNDFIALFKDTAVCSIITVVELSKEYYIHARSTGAVVELGIVTALFYLMMSYPLSKLTTYLEYRLQGPKV
jgi:polar amino acid transport system substrate-binding protein